MSFSVTTVGFSVLAHSRGGSLHVSNGIMLKWKEIWARFLSVYKHAANVTDAVSVADEEFSFSIVCARSGDSWDIWRRLRFAAPSVGRSRERFRYFPPGS
jgi:hypothetical protein